MGGISEWGGAGGLDEGERGQRDVERSEGGMYKEGSGGRRCRIIKWRYSNTF